MAWLGSAWCPGGRTIAIPFLSSPRATLKASSVTQPAAIREACAEYMSFQTVSASTPTPPHGSKQNRLGNVSERQAENDVVHSVMLYPSVQCL